MPETFKCAACGEEKEVNHEAGTGYGIQANTRDKICYACCAKKDTEWMQTHDRTLLYWDGRNVTNWPGSLVIKPTFCKKGRHNLAKTRYDVWFQHAGKHWHGVNYGENDQTLHCRAVKN